MKLIPLLLSVLLLAGCASGTKLLQKNLRFTEAVATTDVKPVFDKEYDTKAVQNFRKSDELKISGSATFTDAGARFIAKVAPVVLVIDLRQESHGIVNNRPLTWQSDRNWSNAGMGADEVIEREKRYLSELHIGEKLSGAKIRSVETEESLIRSLGQSYLRLAVTEHLRPSNSQVDRFIEGVRNMPPTSWVHFHGRSGKGRTTMFMVMYDMLRTAWNTSYEDILQRNIELSEDSEVTAIASEGNWRRPYQEDRVSFLIEFYKYAKAHPNGAGAWWSGWAN